MTAMYKIGDKIRRTPFACINNEQEVGRPCGGEPQPWIERLKNAEGTVVYIHPRLRFITVEYEIAGYKLCESFKLNRYTGQMM